jgi:hypothetical protein
MPIDDRLFLAYHFSVDESIGIGARAQSMCRPCANLAASMALRPSMSHHLVAGNRGGTRESV